MTRATTCAAAAAATLALLLCAGTASAQRCNGLYKLRTETGSVSDGSAPTDYTKRVWFNGYGNVQSITGLTTASDGWRYFRYNQPAGNPVYDYDLCTPGQYPEMCYLAKQGCSWDINVGSPARIEFTVEQYHVEPEFDTVRIFEGTPTHDTAGVVLASHDGSTEDLSCEGCVESGGLASMGPNFRPAGIDESEAAAVFEDCFKGEDVTGDGSQQQIFSIY